MRRLWMSLLLVPLIAMAIPTAALASPSAPAAATRTLQAGMKGSAVKTLQRRLAALKYYPGSIDGQFGTSTLEAVWAFQEVQGLPGHDYVSSAMQQALAHPRAPKVLDRGAGAAVEHLRGARVGQGLLHGGAHVVVAGQALHFLEGPDGLERAGAELAVDRARVVLQRGEPALQCLDRRALHARLQSAGGRGRCRRRRQRGSWYRHRDQGHEQQGHPQASHRRPPPRQRGGAPLAVRYPKITLWHHQSAGLHISIR